MNTTTKHYLLVQLGYEPTDLFTDEKIATLEFMQAVNDSLARAKRVSKQARKHKLSPTCYRITLGNDKNSTLYSHFSLETEI